MLGTSRETGIISGAIAVSVGMLPARADQDVENYRDPRLKDRSRPIITTCNVGALASFGAKTLKDMGFPDVIFLMAEPSLERCRTSNVGI